MREELIAELEHIIEPDRGEELAHYFGIKPGGYGEGDILLGIHTPTLRKIVAKHKNMSDDEVLELLHSPVHDYRFAALEIMKLKYKMNPDFYQQTFLKNTAYVNNWDLIDNFAPHIIGRYALETHDESHLRALCHSKNFWERRMSVVAYMAFYRKGLLGDGLDTIDYNYQDPEPLIHKACGWMLRIIWVKIDKHLVESYLIGHYDQMPRACLRNAIERMPEEQRQYFLKGEFRA